MFRRSALASLAAMLLVPTFAGADAADCTRTLGRQIGSLLKKRLKASG